MNFIDKTASRALAEIGDPNRGLALRRNTAIDLVTALIDWLDDTEADCDLEPWLAGPEGADFLGLGHDLEGDGIDLGDWQGEGSDNPDDEDDGTAEPSLGAPEIPPTYVERGGFYGWQTVQGTQVLWSQGHGLEEEESADAEDAGGGDVQDDPHDGGLDLTEGDADEDKEPDLGWSNPGWDGTVPLGWSYDVNLGDA